jgi:gliding motility-associated-like protein
MLRKVSALFFLLLMCYLKAQSQTTACSTLGQTPATAFPVCGTSTFNQQTVPPCVNASVHASTCGSYPDSNPFWYRFTCYQTGTLEFAITPTNLNDDYDWELFDITGHNPAEVYTNPALAITANWSGNTSLESGRGYTGITGTSSTATDVFVCASNPQELGGFPPYVDATTFSKMPTIIQGHIYLLLVSHFSGNNQSGYALSFNGGSAVITDSLKPAMQNIRSNCSGETLYLKINKKIKCNSLASDGSDFSISPMLANVKSVLGANCSGSFDMDSIVISLDEPLPPGNYQLIINKGSDNNTLVDNCDNAIPQHDSIALTVYPLAPTPMDSLTPVQCAPDVISLVFRNQIRCSSVAADGSDFIVNGSVPVSVIGAYGDSCSNGLSSVIKVKLNKPLQNAGNFTITLKTGSDGNTLIDECAQETPAGSSLDFITSDTVSAAFNYRLNLGCKFDTLFYMHDAKDEVDEWNWAFDVDGISHTQDSFFVFNDYGTKHITLNVSNGVCSDSAATDITLDNELISRFKVSPSAQICPEDAATFTDSSIGKVVSWYWIFGDGTTSIFQNPAPKYYPAPPTRDGRMYPAALIVKNDIGCFDTSRTMIKVFYNCYIAVPSAFTPNGDGLNDYLYPLNAYKADNLEFRVFNRWGQLVFETKDWTKKWDGTISGNPQPAGVYVWMLHYTNRDTGQIFSLKGTTVLIR